MRIIICLQLGCTLAALLVFPVHADPSEGALGGVLNATYLIEKQAVPLVNGRAEFQAAPGSAIKVSTEVFGKPTYGDLNHDGRDDAALFLVHDPGGSGTFYYVAAAIATNDSYRGTNAVLLGDRIFPRTIHIRNGVIVVEFDDRNPDQPMAAAPSIGKTKYLTLKEGHLEVNKAP
ncbi:MAG: hypothetical protein JSV83_12625 [Desulfobacterales bacterium]|nr:MAG: hypothetical protein JSV83_12625 [Desulfobacterales bacterium]